MTDSGGGAADREAADRRTGADRSEQAAAPAPPAMSAKGPPRVNTRREGSVVQRDEDRLVEAARTDRRAFGELYDRHVDAIYNYIARRVGDEQVAEDLTAAVWERALKAIDHYQLRGVPFGAWLYRIAGNLVANHHRRRKLWRMVPFAARHARTDPRERMDERAAVHEALNRLSQADQEVLGLFYFAGMSPPEMAQVLRCTPAAVHKRLHRARTRLRRHLEGDSRVATHTS